MAGSNPYVAEAEYTLPARPYCIVFVDPDGAEQVVEVAPERLPYGRTGLPGSVLDVALEHGLDIEHSCGGVVACSTCHVYVEDGGDTCNEPDDAELDMLDNAPAVKPHSRLACQCVGDGRRNLRVRIPAWNRNAVRETPHG